ncbi:MAG: carbon-nitrogen hydrolase family protein [Thermoplasmatales archaeon]
MRIALVQFKIQPLLTDKNIERAERFLKISKEKGADLVIFPEEFLAGPLRRLTPQFGDSEFKYREIFCELAKKYRIDIVPGTIVEKECEQYFNVAYYIDSFGNVKCRYKKIHIYNTELRYVSRGSHPCVFTTKFDRTGLAICWDLAFPELFRQLLFKKATLIIVPSHWSFIYSYIPKSWNTKHENEFLESLLYARAFENEAVIAYCNAGGEYSFSKYKEVLIGHSQVISPLIGTIQKCSHNKEAILIADNDKKILKRAERIYKIRRRINEIRTYYK